MHLVQRFVLHPSLLDVVALRHQGIEPRLVIGQLALDLLDLLADFIDLLIDDLDLDV